MPASDTSLAGLSVVDLGVGMAAALVAKFLCESGARIDRIEPAAADPFYDVYPAYEVWRRGISIRRAGADIEQQLSKMLASADICIIGGEDYPGLHWRRDAANLQAQYPRLIVLNIEAYPSGTRHAGRPGCEVLVQARSGVASEHYSRRPLYMAFGPANYGAALHGLVGLYAALLHRERMGRGQLVSTSMFEGAMSWPLYLWCEFEKPTPAANFELPKDPWPLIFKGCDGKYVQILLGSAGSKYKLYKVLGIDDPTVLEGDSGMPQPGGNPKNFYGEIDLLSAHVTKFDSRELVQAIWAQGLPAEPVLEPGRCWDDPQVVHNAILVREPDGLRHVAHPMDMQPLPARQAVAVASDGTMPNAPLAGMRVVDFGAFVAGPYASTLLSDLGAEVIKVEPMAGDPNRTIPRSNGSVNRGKRAISIDMKSPEGVKIAQQLCMAADVVTSNFRPGASARLGIDAPTLHKLKPQLVVLESAAYGATGPRAGGSGFDMCFQALCGHDWRAGGQGNAPLCNRTAPVDFAGGLLGGIAALKGLYQRARSGAGVEMGTSLMNAGLFLMSELLQRPDGQFVGAPCLNHAQTGFHPAEQFYEAADGWLAVAARDDAMAQRLLKVLGLDLQAPIARKLWDQTVADAIAGAIKPRKVDEVVALLQGVDVWVEACCSNGEPVNLHDPDLIRMGTVYRSQHPQYGEVKQIGPLVRLSAAQRPHSRHMALPGEHTNEVLAELGYTAAQIEDLRARKIVK